MSQLPAFQLPFGSASTITATGTTQGTAALLSGQSFTAVTSATSLSGVILPASLGVGQSLTIANESSTGVLIYPASGNAIDALGANVGYFLPSQKSVTIRVSTSSLAYSTDLSDLTPETSVTVASASTTPIGGAYSRYVKLNFFLPIDTAFDIIKVATNFLTAYLTMRIIIFVFNFLRGTGKRIIRQKSGFLGMKVGIFNSNLKLMRQINTGK